MKKRCLAFAMILLLLLLSGCYDVQDIGNTVAVIAMGIDRVESGLYRVSFHIETTGSDMEGKTSSSNEEKDVIVVEGETIDAAYQLANELTGVDLSLENLKMTVLSEVICREGILAPIEALLSINRIKNNAFVVASKGDAETILKSVNPEDKEYLSIYYEQILFNRYRWNTRFFFLEEVYFNLIGDPGQDILLPAVFRSGSYVSGNTVEFLGGAIFDEGHLVKFLNEDDMMIARLLSGTFHAQDIQAEYPKGSGRHVILSLMQEGKPKIHSEIIDGQIYETIVLRLSGKYQTLRQKEDYKMFEKHFTELFREDMQRKCEIFIHDTAVQDQVDICAIGKHLRSSFKDIQSFKAFDYKSKLAKGHYKVEIKLNMRCIGRFAFE